MNHTRVIGVLIILLFSMSTSLIGITEDPQPYVNITAYSSYGPVAPGMSLVPINFTIINTGNVNLTNVYIFPGSVWNLITPVTNTPVKIPFLMVGKQFTIPFLFNFSANAGMGPYQIPLYIGYTLYTQSGVTYGNTTIYSTIYLLGRVNLVARAYFGTSNNPLLVAGGERNIPLTIVITNIGNVLISNLTLIFPKNGYPLKFLENNYTIGYLPIGTPISIVTYVDVNPNISEGVYEIPITATYFKGAKTSLEVPIDVNGNVNFIINGLFGSANSTLNVAPGSVNVPLTIYVINTGTSTVSNATLYFNSTYPIKFLVDNVRLGYVSPSRPGIATVLVDIYPNATVGVYEIPVTISYNNGVNQNVLMRVYITGQVNITAVGIFGSTQNPLVVAAGEKRVPLTIILQNTGNTILTNASVYLPNSTYPIQFLEKSVNVGYIPVGTPIQFNTVVNLSDNISSGIYSIPIKVKYFNNEIITVNLRVSILGNVDFTGLGIFGTQTNPLVVAPGMNNIPLTILLQNIGNVIANNVTIIFNSTYPLKFLEDNVSIGYLPAGQPVPITTFVNILGNLSTGVYMIKIIVKYFDNMEKEIEIPININGFINLQLDTIWGTPSSPITASPGSNNIPLTILVKNTGTVTVTNASLILNSSYPIQFLNNVLSVGYVPAGSSNYATVTANVYKNVTPGTYIIPIKIRYFQNQEISTSLKVIIYSPKIAVNVFTYPPEIFSNSVNPYIRLSVLLVNYGEGIANDLFVTINSNLTVVSQNNITIGSLPPGRPANITFLLKLPTTYGTYPIKFNITYDGGSQTIVYPLEVKPSAYLIVKQVYYSGLTPGATSVPITIVIENIGNETAKNLNLLLSPSNIISPHISSSNPLGALTAGKIYVGDLSPGQIINVTYLVDVSNGISEGAYPLTIIALWNQTGSLYPFTQNIVVYAQITQPFYVKLFSSYIFYITIVIIIIILAIVLLMIRRKRRK